MLTFNWDVPLEGHEFISAYRFLKGVQLGIDRTTLHPCLSEKQGMYKPYEPLKIYDLFIQFASVKEDTESILAFANKFGSLGLDEHVIVPQPGRLTKGKEGKYVPYDESKWYEPLDTWILEIKAMNYAVKIWNTLNQDPPNIDVLEQHVLQTNGHITWLFEPNDNRSLSKTFATLHPDWSKLHAEESGNVALDNVGWLVLQEIVNKHLKQRVSPLLLHNARGKSVKSNLYLYPLSLAGALWLQLAQAIDRVIGIKTCQRCNKWFIAKRSHAKFCSGNCRQQNDYHKLKNI